MDLNSLLTLLTFLGGGAAGAIGGIATAARWYADSEKKKYAAERDFNHLRKNQEQQAKNMELVMEEVEFLNKAVVRLETLLTSFLGRSTPPS
jgi:hypothetical protein